MYILRPNFSSQKKKIWRREVIVHPKLPLAPNFFFSFASSIESRQGIFSTLEVSSFLTSSLHQSSSATVKSLDISSHSRPIIPSASLPKVNSFTMVILPIALYGLEVPPQGIMVPAMQEDSIPGAAVSIHPMPFLLSISSFGRAYLRRAIQPALTFTSNYILYIG